jgi:hypothetical protein
MELKMNFKFISLRSALICLAPVLLIALCVCPLFAQEPSSGAKSETHSIQDNSFLIEEAYNQDPSVVQHINTFLRRFESHDWVYTFTQEWPVNGIKHQLSYTVAGAHLGDLPGSGAGIGDLAINYRYQLVGSGETRLAVAPRFTVLLPTGNSVYGRGFGATGLQTDTAASIVLSKKFVTHVNAGATWVPHARNELGDRAGLVGYNLGHSLVWLAGSRFNVLVETAFNNFQTVVAPGKSERVQDLLISPGVRWAYNFKSGLQIVPGIAVPLGAGPTAGEKGLILYLSFEHPMRFLYWQRKGKD